MGKDGNKFPWDGTEKNVPWTSQAFSPYSAKHQGGTNSKFPAAF